MALESARKPWRGPLAQLDRASGYEPEGREFDSLKARHSAPLLLFARKASCKSYAELANFIQ